MPSAIVFDLETVPDLSGYAAANGLAGRTEQEIREAIGEKFPKHIYHQIICIGAVIAHFENDTWIIDSIGAPSIQDRPERELIEAFVTKVAQLRPQLITFNGHSFDLPALRYRAMVHEVSAPGLSARSYFKRFSMDSLDLCDELSSFGASGSKVTLDELSKIIGLPGKPGHINGKEVDAYFRAGRIKEIADYCETDVVNTYLVWLRYEFFCGRLSKAGYDGSSTSVSNFIQRNSASKPHLGHFLATSTGARRHVAERALL